MFEDYMSEHFSNADTRRAAAWGMRVSIFETTYMQLGRAWSLS